MRRLLAIPLVVVGLLIAGCGGGDDSGSALDSALAFLPKDTPFAFVADTDVGGDQYKNMSELIDKFPFGDQVKSTIRGQLEQLGNGVDFNDDVKPVLGNPAVMGAADTETVTGDKSNYILALQAKDREHSRIWSTSRTRRRWGRRQARRSTRRTAPTSRLGTTCSSSRTTRAS